MWNEGLTYYTNIKHLLRNEHHDLSCGCEECNRMKTPRPEDNSHHM